MLKTVRFSQKNACLLHHIYNNLNFTESQGKKILQSLGEILFVLTILFFLYGKIGAGVGAGGADSKFYPEHEPYKNDVVPLYWFYHLKV
jgi:hypothetical protein